MLALGLMDEDNLCEDAMKELKFALQIKYASFQIKEIGMC